MGVTSGGQSSPGWAGDTGDSRKVRPSVLARCGKKTALRQTDELIQHVGAPGWDFRNRRTLEMGHQGQTDPRDGTSGTATQRDSPKHLLWLVARSTKTLAEMTLPKGKNICVSSASPNSWGR